MSNKLIIASVVLLALIGAAYFYSGGNAKKANAPAYVLDPLNATYTFAPDGGEPIKLSGGNFSRQDAPGSACTETVRIFGQPALGDLDGNGTPDAAVLIQDNTCGTGVFYSVAAAIGTATGTLGTNALLLGDRIAPQTMQISDGKITVNYADRLPGEPMAAQPSVGVSRYFMVQNGTLVELK